jgi:hypothetical protein
MTIAFPRAVPDGIRFAIGTTFDLMPVEATNRAGESVQSMELGDPYWMARFMTVPLLASQRAVLQAWRATLRGGKTFYAYDPFRAFPLAYGEAVLALTRAGGGLFDGTAKITTNNLTTIALATLASGQIISVGDMIELPRANSQIGLHQATEAATASGGGVATVAIDPPAFADTIINATSVRMVRARCTMAIVPDTFSAPGGNAQAASFQAVQTLA